MKMSIDWFRLIGGGALTAILFATNPGHAASAGDLPDAKKTLSALYLEAREVPSFIQSNGGAAHVLFLDVRTRAEAMFVGMPEPVDGLAPFVELQELMTDWDPQRNAYKMEPNQNFVAEVQRRLDQKKLSRNDVVVLMCRSGDRSSRAANRLSEAGFTRVYSVIDGFEGDLGKDGRRTVNGWKNAGLPWSYQLDRSKMYFAN